ncbi:type II toxin-antitoxin system VapC family toxin [Candidatus Bathyarchaeota archaeon A05DMB-2]|nr:type II toxin-antitoxin system VapC family toxin [Candidatus Bathyarchaeota archaeon A05DMB-2]
MASNVGGVEKRVFDVNVLAIFLVKGHPGCGYVSPVVEAGLRGAYVPLVMDILPVRAYWIMTRRWSLPERESAAAIEHFVKTYDVPRYPSLARETILEGFRLAEELKHDVFDCMYVAFARQEEAKGIVTTDTDFERLCKHVGLDYINPVPREVLKRFKEQNK